MDIISPLPGERQSMTPSGIEVVEFNLGRGNIGANTMLHSYEWTQYAEDISEYNRPVTNPNTARCIDGRPFASIGPITDPAQLEEQVLYQLPGGVGLATTKALVAANARVVQGKNFRDAYEITSSLLLQLPGGGIIDAGHHACGASKFVKKTAEEAVRPSEVGEMLGAIMTIEGKERAILNELFDHKKALLENGFYDEWDAASHEHFLEENFPDNFARLRVPADTSDGLDGHYEVGLFIAENGGFAKNAAFEGTGKMTFAYSNELALKLANTLGTSHEERVKIYLAFYDDLVNLGGIMFANGFPIMTDMKPAHSLQHMFN